MNNQDDLQKRAEIYLDVQANTDNFCVEKAFIAGATSQDAISRKDEREKIITLFQDKLDLLDIYSFGKREWEIVRNIFKQVLEETTK